MSSSAATTFGSPAAPLVKEKKKLSKKSSSSAARKESVSAAAETAMPKSTSTPEMGAAQQSTAGAAPAAPAEPEQHVDGDVVESAVRSLKGTRPDLLRTTTYYEGAKVCTYCRRAACAVKQTGEGMQKGRWVCRVVCWGTSADAVL